MAFVIHIIADDDLETYTKWPRVSYLLRPSKTIFIPRYLTEIAVCDVQRAYNYTHSETTWKMRAQISGEYTHI